MKVLIVDDERLARLRLHQLLEGMPDVDVVGEAAGATEAIGRTRERRPDVLLLDVQMPRVDGISLARQLPGGPLVIFTTAHRTYAPEAFELRAVDYLLKPIKRARLVDALERAKDALTSGRDPRRSDEPVRISARVGSVYEIFDARDITRLTAADKYVVFRVDGRELLIEQSLRQLEDLLGPHGFVRVHRQDLVNVAHIRRVIFETRSCELEMSDEQRVSVSRRSLPALKRKLGIDRP